MIDDPLGLSRSPVGGDAARVKAWLRELWALDDGTDLLVCEARCHEPGCPPVETVIVMRRPGSAPCERRLHSALKAIDRAALQRLEVPGA